MKNDPGGKKNSQDGKLEVRTIQVTQTARLASASSNEGCLVMVLSGSGMLYWNQVPGNGVGAGPDSVLLLGRRDYDFEPAGGWPAELLVCRFPLEMMSEVQKAQLLDNSKAPVVLLGDPVWSGRMRTLLELRSANFTVAATAEQIIFSVTGYGHGVGMSQYGANAMAQAGSGWREILTHYYTGITIQPWEGEAA